MDETRDDQIEEAIRAKMQGIAAILEGAINPPGKPRKWGFLFALFPFEEQGRFNYISNADRKDIVVLLKEMVARFEGQPEIEGNA